MTNENEMRSKILEIIKDNSKGFSDFKRKIKELYENYANIFKTEIGLRKIGQFYESNLNKEERGLYGQVYTPQYIIDIILKLALNNQRKMILDPAMGSGYFIQHILRYYAQNDASLSFIISSLKNIYGIEIKEIPFKISLINILIEILKISDDISSLTEDLLNNFYNQDFFSPDFLDRFNFRDKFDLIIGNPPYIRQRDIRNKSFVRWHLEQVELNNRREINLISNNIELKKVKISKRADLFVYFITQSYIFLKPGGTLAFIIPNKWMATGYGKDLQEFLLDRFKIQHIILFQEQIFKKILVPSSILIAKKSSRKTIRDTNVVKFSYIKKKIEIEKLSQYLNDTKVEGLKGSAFLMNKISQTQLRNEDKWLKFLTAPDIYWKLKKIKNMVKLEDVSEIKYLIKTGCDDFFYITDDILKYWKIEEEFLKPFANSLNQTQTIEFSRQNSLYHIVDFNQFIKSNAIVVKEKESLEGLCNILKEEIEKTNELRNSKISIGTIKSLTKKEIKLLIELKRAGYNGIFNYMVYSMWIKEDWGRFGPPHQRLTCISHRKSNGYWFNLGELSIPDILVPETCDKRIFSPINAGKFVADVDLTDIYIKKNYKHHEIEDYQENQDILFDFLAAYLNSTFFKLFREIEGRVSGGKASRLKIYELKTILVPNPKELKPSELDSISKSFQDLKTKIINSTAYNSSLRLLDNIFIEILNRLNPIENFSLEELENGFREVFNLRKGE